MNDIKQYLDDAIRTLVEKDDVMKLKNFIEEQSSLIMIYLQKLQLQKRNSSKTSVSKLNAKFGSLEEKLVYFESQNESKTRNFDDLEQYGRRECLRFSGERIIKNYIKDTLKIDIRENDYNRIHRVGPMITNNNGQLPQQITVKLKDFSPRSSVHRARKRKSNIFVYLDLTK